MQKIARVGSNHFFNESLASMPQPLDELPVLLGHVQDEKAPFESKKLHELFEPVEPQTDSALDSVNAVFNGFNPQLFAA